MFGNKDKSDAPAAPQAQKVQKTSKGVISDTTIIAGNLTFKGDIIGDGVVEICGQLDGNVSCSAIHLHNGANVRGNLTAENITLDGKLQGSVHSKQVSISSNARVKGEVFYETLSIKDGAVIEGSCQWADYSKSKSPAAQAAAQPQQAAAKNAATRAASAAKPKITPIEDAAANNS